MVSVMDRHALSEEGLHTITILIGVTLASLILISLLMLLMLQSVVKPLSQLSDYIDKIRQMPLGSEPEPVTPEGCEEITKLSHSFNTKLDEKARLTRDLQEATVNLYESQLDRKQAELDYLRSQINPHFLYNTLETIQGIALEKEVPEIADASGALGKLLRHNIQGSDTVSLNRELEITEAYLTIQKLRFTDKLNVIISVRENTRKLPVMKVLLQPLVENAVYHGLEPKTGPGTLYIGARIEESDLLISIYDDGVDIPAEKLSELQENLDRAPQSLRSAKVHIGLLNVQNRIRLRYGKPYGLSLESTPGKGTKVILRLPVETEKEDGTKEC
jgi:two-component system sensor histidine kinase YesM